MGERDRDVLGAWRPAFARAAALLAFPAALVVAPADVAAAPPSSAVIWPTLTPAGDGPTGGELRLPREKDGALADRAREVDAVLSDTAQDLGLSLDLNERVPDVPGVVRDLELVEESRSTRGWVVSPRIERDGAQLLVRIVAVPPGSKIAMVRTERVTPESLSVRVVVMLRDLVDAHAGRGAAEGVPEAARPTGTLPTRPARSPGRAVLAVSTAAFGGFVGYGLQRTSRGEDPRLLYPLMALGTGVGLGASMIVADEWDVGVGDAWYLAAGTWWPTTTAIMLANGYDVSPSTDSYAYGIVAGIGGTGLASIVLSQKGVSEGAALMTHSGGALGMFLGGTTELLVRGTTEETPYRGLGYGAGAGVLIAGTVATQLDVTPSRVLLTDLGAGLGALAGAAAGSPLLLEDANEDRQRAFLGATLGGTVLGAGIALWMTRPSGEPAPARAQTASPRLPLPSPGVIAVSAHRGRVAPALGLSWGGVF